MFCAVAVLTYCKYLFDTISAVNVPSEEAAVPETMRCVSRYLPDRVHPPGGGQPRRGAELGHHPRDPPRPGHQGPVLLLLLIQVPRPHSYSLWARCSLLGVAQSTHNIDTDTDTTSLTAQPPKTVSYK